MILEFLSPKVITSKVIKSIKTIFYIAHRYLRKIK